MSKIINYIRSSTKFQSVLVWLVIYIILFVQPLWASWKFSIIIASITIIFFLVVYYGTQRILIPKLLIKRKKTVYTIVSIVMIIIFAHLSARSEIFVSKILDVEPEHGLVFIFSVSRFVTFFTITYAISNIIFFSKKTVEDAKQKEVLLSEKKMLEVRVLKSQINSHFIFNALNNIYSMTYFKDEYTSGYVLKLAQMMRYVMEDCETELTPLSKEIEYIENFIDFQRLRFENDKDISFSHNIRSNSNIVVPPMIFQPLVENCFKHTPLDVDKNSYIHILLEIKENQIHFVSENSQPMIKNKSSLNNTGIGIENVKRRLVLHYENKYVLNIFDNANCFRVELLIDLK
ncbi:MAG: histidine kinase [Dysgonomonas sp.]|nr:histidine kinase [Dysgonomonas sp.]